VRALPHAADVTLGNVSKQAHVPQIAEREKYRRVHAGGNRLPDVHIPADDDTVDRRADDGVFEIDSSFGNAGLRRADAGIGALHIGFRLQHRGAREIELGPRQLFIAGERLRALQLPSRIVENRLPLGALGAGLRKPGLGFDQLGLKRRGIQSRQDLPSFTVSLKSTSMDPIVPETCEPTSTMRAGSSVPVTSARRTIGPEVTSVVWT